MPDAMVDQVRRFNRVVTERVGALNDHFLGRERPLGEARLLWEIGLAGCEVRLLRARHGRWPPRTRCPRQALRRARAIVPHTSEFDAARAAGRGDA
jgi:hypothetical protein